jgi:hypothetical protein
MMLVSRSIFILFCKVPPCSSRELSLALGNGGGHCGSSNRWCVFSVRCRLGPVRYRITLPPDVLCLPLAVPDRPLGGLYFTNRVWCEPLAGCPFVASPLGPSSLSGRVPGLRYCPSSDRVLSFSAASAVVVPSTANVCTGVVGSGRGCGSSPSLVSDRMNKTPS